LQAIYNMRYLILFLAFFPGIFFQSCIGQQKANDISLTDLTFSSIFGDSKKDSVHTYCLLGTGYFRAPRSDNSDSLIKVWLVRHPQAKVIPVATHGPTMTDYPGSKITYCWLVDGKDTINNYLVKNGCFPGGTMMRPETYDEMSKQMKDIYKGIAKPNIVVHVNKKDYEDFIEQIKAAEMFAESNKLGIWKKMPHDE
jgi:hypothetical protein